MIIRKKYYPIKEAAELLECSILDIIHHGAISTIKIHCYIDMSWFTDGKSYKSRSNWTTGFYIIKKDDLQTFELKSKNDNKLTLKGAIWPKDNQYRQFPESIVFVNAPSKRDMDLDNIYIFSEELDALKSSNQKQKQPQTHTENPKSINSLLIMIITMAKDGYRYNHKGNRSKLPREISEYADTFGLKIDEDTARKWLKEAAAVLDKDID